MLGRVKTGTNIQNAQSTTYSYLPNKRAGPNKHVGWNMGQN